MGEHDNADITWTTDITEVGPGVRVFRRKDAKVDPCPANRPLWDQLTELERAIWQVGYDFGYQECDNDHEFDKELAEDL